jgi:hypothetical protein
MQDDDMQMQGDVPEEGEGEETGEESEEETM